MTYVGIDLGTTYSVVAHLDSNGVATTLPNAEGDLTTPSAVLYESDGEIIVGREAKLAATAVPDDVAQCAKRYLGDEHYPTPLGGAMRSPVEISAEVLKKLKADAEQHLGPIRGAVVTVPAYFDEGRRHATAEAGRLAGLNVLDVINEPTAAALAYAYEQYVGRGGSRDDRGAMFQAVSRARTVLVYDLGGGTFDVTLLRIDGTQFRVLSTEGDVRLGGRDWDEALVKLFAQGFAEEHGSDPRDNPLSNQALYKSAEEAKRNLSSRSRTHYVVNHAGHAMTGSLTREQFEQVTKPLLYRTERRVNRVLNQAKITWGDVDEVITVGGSTRMPQVLAMLESVTGKSPNTSMSPDESVARGAAIHAAARIAGIAATHLPATGARPDRRLQHQTEPGKSAATPRPAKAKPLTPSVSGLNPPSEKPNDPASKPEQGSPTALSGEIGGYMTFLQGINEQHVEVLSQIDVIDVNSHSFGVIVKNEAGEKLVSCLIPRNTALPARAVKRYGTVVHSQKSVSIRVVEGESNNVEHCIAIGVCRLRLPLGLPARSPIEVAFEYDDGGRLHVKGKSPGCDDWTSIVIDRSRKQSA